MPDSEFVSVTLDATELAEKLFRANRLKGLLKAVGQQSVNDSKAAFAAQKYDGVSWIARAVPNMPGIIRDLTGGPSIQQGRFESRPALVDSGWMRDSLNYRIIDKGTVEIYTEAEYAGLHMTGGPWEMRISPVAKKNLRHILKQTKGQRSGPFWEHRGILSFLAIADSISGEVPPRPFMGLPKNAEGIFGMMALGHFTNKVVET